MADAPEPQATPQIEPLEAHIVALRAELGRTQLTLRITTGALLAVCALLSWQAVRGAA